MDLPVTFAPSAKLFNVSTIRLVESFPLLNAFVKEPSFLMISSIAMPFDFAVFFNFFSNSSVEIPAFLICLLNSSHFESPSAPSRSLFLRSDDLSIIPPKKLDKSVNRLLASSKSPTINSHVLPQPD